MQEAMPQVRLLVSKVHASPLQVTLHDFSNKIYPRRPDSKQFGRLKIKLKNMTASNSTRYPQKLSSPAKSVVFSDIRYNS